MAETAQIAEIARIVADEIFKPFGWDRAGTSDHNFKGPIPQLPAAEPNADMDDAEEDETPASKDPKKTDGAAPSPGLQLKDYPADVVFFYEDPYSLLRTYIHFDLKSYAAATLKGSKVVGALKSLSRAIAAAELSEDWGNKFAPQQSNYRIHGGLFVYNHDNLARGRFNEFFSKLTPHSAQVPEKKNIYVFSPDRIGYLLSVLNDIKGLRADSILPLQKDGEVLYYYPYGVKVKPLNNLLSYATAEMLLGPLLIVRYRFHDGSRQPGYIVYYDGPGAQVEEFLYIFELLLKRRLLTDADALHLRLQSPADNAFLVFKTAKDEFAKAYHDLPAFRKQVDEIKYGRGARVQLEFSTVELGMD
jgi:hypothetical protein